MKRNRSPQIRQRKAQKPRSDRFDARLSDEQRDTIYGWMSSKSSSESVALIKERFGLPVSQAALSRWHAEQYSLRNSTSSARIVEGLLTLHAQVKNIEQRISVLIDEARRDSWLDRLPVGAGSNKF